jgi:hypothetical protein
MPLTKAEIFFLLEAIREKYGMGYSDAEYDTGHAGIVEVGKLQGKLSIMLEVAGKREARG